MQHMVTRVERLLAESTVKRSSMWFRIAVASPQVDIW